MTDIVFDVDRDTPGGLENASGGVVVVSRSSPSLVDNKVITADEFLVEIPSDTPTFTISVPPSDGVTWCWTFSISTHTTQVLRHVEVQDSPTPVQYTALVDVDPKTLNPETPMVPVWKQYVDSADTAVQAGIGPAIEAAVAALVGAAPETLNTLKEITDQLSSDESAAAALAATVAAKLAKASNLSDLADVATARTNLGLGTAATHAHSDYATAAQGTKADAAIPSPASHSDGRVVAWSNTLGAYVEVAPAGAVLKAAAKNDTNTPTTCSATSGALGTAVSIPLTAISVSDSGGLPVIIRWSGCWQQTVAGAGLAMLELYETTSTPTLVRGSEQRLPNVITSPECFFTTPSLEFDIGVVTTTRTFELRCQLWAASGSNPTAKVLNQPTQPTMIRSGTGI